MRTPILTGLILAGVLATTAVQAATPSSIESVEALYSGLSAGEVQRIHMTAEQGMRAHKSTCTWHEVANKAIDPLFAAYPGSEANFGEKDYLAATNQNFVC